MQISTFNSKVSINQRAYWLVRKTLSWRCQILETTTDHRWPWQASPSVRQSMAILSKKKRTPKKWTKTMYCLLRGNDPPTRDKVCQMVSILLAVLRVQLQRESQVSQQACNARQKERKSSKIQRKAVNSLLALRKEVAFHHLAKNNPQLLSSPI